MTTKITVRSVACPKCGVAAGEKCVGRFGVWLWLRANPRPIFGFHVARKRAAKGVDRAV